jgi:uncharacterized repeat protein (TIGR01451 family)
VTFTSSGPQGGLAGAPKARIYVGLYEGRVSPIADTDPATNVGTGENNLDNVAKFVRGSYEFTAHAPGYGHIRFRQFFLGGGQNLTINLAFPTNLASTSQGATITFTNGNIAFQNRLIDDTERTQWERLQPHNATTGAQPDVAGSQATIKLAGTDPVAFNRVQVSALLGPGHNRFQALRQFEVFACTTNANVANPTCNGALAQVNGVTPGFTRVYLSPNNAFPGVPPRPAAPDMVLRSFPVNVTTATHVQIQVATNQCTGNPQFQGDQDADVSGDFPDPLGHRTDCRVGAFPYGVSADVPALGTVGLGRAPQRGNVRIAEFQVFSAASVVGDPVDQLPAQPEDPVVTLTKTGPVTARAGTEVSYKLEYKNLGPAAASTAKLVDTLPTGVSFVSASAGGTYDAATRKVTWNLGTVGVNAGGTRSLTIRLAPSTPLGTVIINTAEFIAPLTVAPPAGVTTLVTR